MNHRRVVRVVVCVTAVYLAALCLWLLIAVPRTPSETIGAQLIGIVGLFGAGLAVGLLWAQHPTRADRKLYKHGWEGWAEIESIHRLRRTPNLGEIDEIELHLTVPGSLPYSGRLVREVYSDEKQFFVPGATIPIRVDPKNRDHIMLCP